MDVDVAQEKRFAEAIRVVTREMEGRRSKVGEWMAAASSAKTKAKRFTEPYQRRLRLCAIKDAETYVQRAKHCDDETRPEVVDRAISQFVAELAVLREKTHVSSTASQVKLRHCLPKPVPTAKGAKVASSKAVSTATASLLPGGKAAKSKRQIKNTTHDVESITDRLMAKFGVIEEKTFVHMDEVCDRCGINKEVIVEIGLMWCPGCARVFDNTDMGVQSVDSSRKRLKDPRYSLVKKMIKDIRHAQAQEPTAVNLPTIRVVARILVQRGHRDPKAIPFSETDYVVRNLLTEADIKEEAAAMARKGEAVGGGLEEGSDGDEDEDEEEGSDREEEDAEEAVEKEMLTAAEAKARASKARRVMRTIFRHIPQIHCRVTGQAPLRFTARENRMIQLLFQVIAENYDLFKGDRTNFMSYKHVIYRVCEILDITRALPFFSSLKPSTKTQHDKILVKIVNHVKLPDLISRTPDSDARAKAFYHSIGCRVPSVLRCQNDDMVGTHRKKRVRFEATLK